MGCFGQKYKTEDAGTKKFFVAKFLDFKIIDSKTVIFQVQELQVIIHDLMTKCMDIMNSLLEHIKVVLDNHITFVVGLIVNEAFQVAAIIEKLSLSWKEFKNYLKHKRMKMSVKDLIVRLRIEEDNKATEKRSKGNSAISRANIVEDEPNNSKKRKKASRQQSNPPKRKFKGNCFNCVKADHKSVDCRP